MVDWSKEHFSNLKTVDIGQGIHFLQEDNPHLIGRGSRRLVSGALGSRGEAFAYSAASRKDPVRGLVPGGYSR